MGNENGETQLLIQQQYEVNPEALLGLAGMYDGEAAALSGQSQSFAGSAESIRQAFGLLGIRDGALQKYVSLLNSTVKALGQLGQVLDSDAERLRSNACVYTEAERQIATNIRSVGTDAGAGTGTGGPA
ncbi:uncharacterized protein YukE [Streptacidiphilus sp. BW17]|uniref:ESX-1 secretion-associated protein n=1 Tax=Streptacidiphilus sp. BW17 TaxID=3156274 RepID=UPI00351109C7